MRSIKIYMLSRCSRLQKNCWWKNLRLNMTRSFVFPPSGRGQRPQTHHSSKVKKRFPAGLFTSTKLVLTLNWRALQRQQSSSAGFIFLLNSCLTHCKIIIWVKIECLGSLQLHTFYSFFKESLFRFIFHSAILSADLLSLCSEAAITPGNGCLMGV